MINANGIKNGANGVNCGRKTVADYREESVCNTGILCGRNGYIKKNGFQNVCFFTGKRQIAAPLPEFYQWRIIFWYDEDKEFKDKLDEVVLENAKVIALTGNNAFSVKNTFSR